MLVTYFDEVKYQKGRSPYYWLGAIVADATTIWTLEKEVNDLAESVFGHRHLTKHTEFHAADMLNAHGPFEGWGWDRRIDTLKRLITVFGSTQNLFKVYVRMDPQKMLSSDVEGMAFMFLIERIDQVLQGQKQPGILIGDRESETIAGKFATSLSAYRMSGTRFAYGKELKHLLDTVHFTHSHHSRMLQLADLHVWLQQLCWQGKSDKWHRQQIIDHVRTINGCLFPSAYKVWPTDSSWLRV